MSYSFSLKATTKDGLKSALGARLDELVAQQPVHARDRGAILANASAAIDLLADDDSRDVSVSCNGYLSWTNNHGTAVDDSQFSTVSVGCSACYIKREEAVPA